MFWYIVLPWLKTTYPENNYVWQQNGAPAHTSKKVQKFCSTNMASFCSKNFWPLSLSDLNSLDYFWWCAIDSKTNHTSHGNLDSSIKLAVSSHASQHTETNQVKMFGMPTPMVLKLFFVVTPLQKFAELATHQS